MFDWRVYYEEVERVTVWPRKQVPKKSRRKNSLYGRVQKLLPLILWVLLHLAKILA